MLLLKRVRAIRDHWREQRKALADPKLCRREEYLWAQQRYIRAEDLLERLFDRELHREARGGPSIARLIEEREGTE